MNPLRQVQPGDPFKPSAGTHNRLVKGAELALAQAQRRGKGIPGLPQTNQTVVLVKNTTGAAVDRFGVLGVGGTIITPAENEDLFKNQIMLVGVTPTAAHSGKFVVLDQPLAAGEIGLAVAAGACVAKVNVINEGHAFADAGGSAASLVSGDTGPARILYKETGTGVKNAVVVLGGGGGSSLPSVTLKLVSNHADNATYYVYYAARAPVVDPATWVPPILSSNQALGINLNELAADGTATGHQLSTSRLPIFFEGFFEGYSNDATPLPVYRFYGNQIGC